MTEVAEPSSAARPRPARRSLTELPVTFLDRAFVESLAAARGEPSWLLEDRLAALTAYESLEVEAAGAVVPLRSVIRANPPSPSSRGG